MFGSTILSNHYLMSMHYIQSLYFVGVNQPRLLCIRRFIDWSTTNGLDSRASKLVCYPSHSCPTAYYYREKYLYRMHGALGPEKGIRRFIGEKKRIECSIQI